MSSATTPDLQDRVQTITDAFVAFDESRAEPAFVLRPRSDGFDVGYIYLQSHGRNVTPRSDSFPPMNEAA